MTFSLSLLLSSLYIVITIDLIRILTVRLERACDRGSCGGNNLHWKRFPRISLSFMLVSCTTVRIRIWPIISKAAPDHADFDIRPIMIGRYLVGPTLPISIFHLLLFSPASILLSRKLQSTIHIPTSYEVFMSYANTLH